MFKVGIIGAGWIAEKMAASLAPLPGYRVYAIASRSRQKAETFAKSWGIEKAYGSYDQLVDDPLVDLVYIATPHSHHYAHAMLAVSHHKAVLVEKAFTANARQCEPCLPQPRAKACF
jgi:predicted dehydrogenase